MEGLIRFLEKYFMPVAGRIAEQRHLRALRDGIVATIPLILIGSAFLVIAFPPVAFLAAMVKPYVGNLLMVVNATFGIMALVAAFSIAFSLAGSYKLDTLSAGVLSVSAFILAMPFTKDGNIASAWMGSKGLFVAMLIGVFVVEVQRYMTKRNLVIKMPEGVPSSVARSFAALFPGFIILTLVWVVNVILLSTVGLPIPEVINTIITNPLLHLGGTLGAILIAELVVQLLWSVGIHGAALVGGIMSPIWLAFTQQNAIAKAAGQVIPNIISQQFVDVFVLIGGSGTTLALAVLLFTRVKSKQLKALGKTAIWPGLFNINEPITFGMPIVMNPVMIIPWVLAPLTVAVITYVTMAAGLVGKPYALLPWTTPVFFSGFLATGDWKAVLLQLVNFIVAGAIYYPFLRVWDKAKLAEEKGMEEAEKATVGGTAFKA
ncbi:phosphotransferase system eiic [Lucifera butyrica]|uniref:Permease IIC component n=1 Tax=Lucifera butyrica TaxID=1351585 RepID=A0A498RCU5_9FIRM|nr:PTS cellobiose transporter subunit IIC [Lucifera butyrica]VBB06988.1 phosphotransferase system eiic [Lucifera butyrica]